MKYFTWDITALLTHEITTIRNNILGRAGSNNKNQFRILNFNFMIVDFFSNFNLYFIFGRLNSQILDSKKSCNVSRQQQCGSRSSKNEVLI